MGEPDDDVMKVLRLMPPEDSFLGILSNRFLELPCSNLLENSLLHFYVLSLDLISSKLL